jgi:hypothetical protein
MTSHPNGTKESDFDHVMRLMDPSKVAAMSLEQIKAEQLFVEKKL